jgi:hypothetical protein
MLLLSLLRITLILLLVIAPASFLLWTGYRWPNSWWTLSDGRTCVCWAKPDMDLPVDPTGLMVELRAGPIEWRSQLPLWCPDDLDWNCISLPLWPFILAAAGAMIWTRRRSLPRHSNGQVSSPECRNSSTPTREHNAALGTPVRTATPQPPSAHLARGVRVAAGDRSCELPLVAWLLLAQLVVRA